MSSLHHSPSGSPPFNLFLQSISKTKQMGSMGFQFFGSIRPNGDHHKRWMHKMIALNICLLNRAVYGSGSSEWAVLISNGKFEAPNWVFRSENRQKKWLVSLFEFFKYFKTRKKLEKSIILMVFYKKIFYCKTLKSFLYSNLGWEVPNKRLKPTLGKK